MTTDTVTADRETTKSDVGRSARQEAEKAGEAVREEAAAVADQARELGRAHAERQFEHGKGAVEEQMDAIGAAVDDAAERLRKENHPLAGYADELSGQLSRLSRGIQESTLDDLAHRTRRLARENPGLFMLGSVAVGFAAARFFKASAEADRRDDDDRRYHERAYAERGYGYGERAYGASGDTYRSPSASADAPYRGSATADRTPEPRVPMDSGASAVPTGATATRAGTAAGAGTSGPAGATTPGTTTAAERASEASSDASPQTPGHRTD